MGLSHTFAEKTAARSKKRKQVVLVTGAMGNIGSYFAKFASKSYSLRLMVHSLDAEAKKFSKYGKVIAAELTDFTALKEICQGVDTVVHLAGDPSPEAVWDDLLEANIVGTYNMFVAAKAAGCRKIIYASSIHAVSGYPADVQVKTSDPVNPGDLYGVSKCFGEALGRYLAEQEGMRVYALRIGAFQPRAVARRGNALHFMESFVSRRDLSGLIKACIDDETLRFGIFHGLSDNRFKRLDMTDARELLSFSPQDDFTAENPKLKPLRLKKNVPPSNLSSGRRGKSGLRREFPPKR